MANIIHISKRSKMEITFGSVGNLLKLLPTGTVIAFESLSPVLSNNGNCRPLQKYFIVVFITLFGLFCFISTFTDSYKLSNGKIHYVFATFKGIWPSPQDIAINSASYKIKFVDFFHAFFSLTVFAVLALLDSNTVGCLYPSFRSNQKKLLMALPPVIGASSAIILAVLFPKNRQGIGYPSNSNKFSDNTNHLG
ncbi:protein DMP2-like [Impatiens glandulifera]|uniref:protein DMP2-like n=1 Tax=Impatiens glandulifera TaxID=253017 RepID=UPI001FB06582|nr:protein DMP2-like [Impatiens glandulifera]